MEVIGADGVAYADIRIANRADRYLREFDPAETDRLRAASGLVRYTTLRNHIQSNSFFRRSRS